MARLLRAAGLAGYHRRRPRTAVADPAQPAAPNLVARDFSAAGVHRLWLGDSTSLPTREGWLYRAVLLEAHSRRVVGWALADHVRTELARDALTMARQARRPSPGLVHHTDRGGQYTARAYQGALAARGLVSSMRRAGDCLDNAMAERCFSTLKVELVDGRSWTTRASARSAVFAWLAVRYNRQRRHAALAYQPPAAFEEELLLLHEHAA